MTNRYRATFTGSHRANRGVDVSDANPTSGMRLERVCRIRDLFATGRAW